MVRPCTVKKTIWKREIARWAHHKITDKKQNKKQNKKKRFLYGFSFRLPSMDILFEFISDRIEHTMVFVTLDEKKH